ncbi:hypothetical protein Hanom_Chr02g00145221 [Helianthus anomalus]
MICLRTNPERNRFESQLHAVAIRESRFLSKKTKAEADLKRVTTNLAEESLSWARDIAEKDHIISRAKAVQEELESKAILEAQKVRSELSTEVERDRIDTDFVYQVQERYHDLTLQLEASEVKIRDKQVELEEHDRKLRELQRACDALVCLNEAKSALDQVNAEVDSLTNHLAGMQGDRNWLISHGLVGAFEYRRRSEPFVVLLDCLSTAAYKSGNGEKTTEMADALEAVYNDSLSAYPDLTSKVAEDGVESLRQMLEVLAESEEE